MTLIEQLQCYDDSYALGVSEVSDIEYDRLKAVARKSFPNDPYFQHVGAMVRGDKIKLPYVLGSLNKTKATDGSYDDWIRQYQDRNELMVYWAKLDGVSLYVEYVEGAFARATTRGDGEYGQDVTEKARLFVAPTIQRRSTVCLRAEALLTGNNHILMGYKTRRNGVAGMLNSDSTTNCELIEVVYYELISDTTGVPETESARISRLEELGLNVAPHCVISAQPVTSVVEMLREWKSTSTFDIDGVVVTPDQSEREDTYYPDNKIAFKVNEEATICTVRGVEWSVGRTGRVTPVVVIDPMIIGGVTVERATGFNADFIFGSRIGVGAKIGIFRSGDVIPYIDFVVDPVPVEYLDTCPSCGSTLQYLGVDVVCVSDNCPDKNLAVIEYFLRTLGCENVTKVTLKKLGVVSIRAAYELDEWDIAELPGFGIKRAEQIVSEIRKTLKTTPDRLLGSFGISGVGVNGAREILKKYNFDDLFALGYDDFVSINGIGDTLATNLVESLPSRRGIYEYLKEEGLQWASSTNTLRGKTFCLTGNGTVKRDVLIKLIEQNGGYVKGMSKNVDVLVTADPASNSGKSKKAREYIAQGATIDIIGYDELMSMLEY
jgi:DNA ligase (NAD+)